MGCIAIVIILLAIGIIGTFYDIFSTAVTDAYHYPGFFIPTILSLVVLFLYRGIFSSSKNKLSVSILLGSIFTICLLINENSLSKRYTSVKFNSDSQNIVIYISDSLNLETEELRKDSRLALFRPGKYNYSAGGDGDFEITKHGEFEIKKGMIGDLQIDLGDVKIEPVKHEIICGRKKIGCSGHWVENTWVPYGDRFK